MTTTTGRRTGSRRSRTAPRSGTRRAAGRPCGRCARCVSCGFCMYVLDGICGLICSYVYTYGPRSSISSGSSIQPLVYMPRRQVIDRFGGSVRRQGEGLYRISFGQAQDRKLVGWLMLGGGQGIRWHTSDHLYTKTTIKRQWSSASRPRGASTRAWARAAGTCARSTSSGA
jgi:hypothetical protein